MIRSPEHPAARDVAIATPSVGQAGDLTQHAVSFTKGVSEQRSTRYLNSHNRPNSHHPVAGLFNFYFRWYWSCHRCSPGNNASNFFHHLLPPHSPRSIAISNHLHRLQLLRRIAQSYTSIPGAAVPSSTPYCINLAGRRLLPL